MEHMNTDFLVDTRVIHSAPNLTGFEFLPYIFFSCYMFEMLS